MKICEMGRVMKKYQIWACLYSLVILVALLNLAAKGFFNARPVSSSMSQTVYSWYYLPHKEGQQPEPMEKAKYIRNYDALYVGAADEKIIYLTFDDCPNNDNIPTILDTLKKHHAGAAFFMTETYIRSHPDVIQRIVSEGSLVCNHTANHVLVTNLSFEKFQAELKGVEDAYFEVTGQQLPKYFRPPQGQFNEVTLSYTEQLGYTTVFWSFRYVDWEVNNQPSEQKAYDTIMGETHPGMIILLHSQSKTNVKILDKIMTDWESEGYTFKTLDDAPNSYLPIVNCR